MAKINPKIIQKIAKKTGQKESTVATRISEYGIDYPGVRGNALAYLYARSKGVNVRRLVPNEERKSLPSKVEVESSSIKLKKIGSRPKAKIPVYFQPYCKDYFVVAHFNELNKALNATCFTASTTLCRKIIENRIIEILRKKYPAEVTLYFNPSKRMMLEFNVLLVNLQNKSKDFGPDSGIITSLVKKCHVFREAANGNTHSFWEIVKTKREFDDHNVDQIFDLLDKAYAVVDL